MERGENTMIQFHKEKQQFVLQTQNTTYSFCVDNEGLLRHLYWGKKIRNPQDLDCDFLSEVSTNDPVHEITPEEFPDRKSVV